jgi:hypothetical protein
VKTSATWRVFIYVRVSPLQGELSTETIGDKAVVFLALVIAIVMAVPGSIAGSSSHADAQNPTLELRCMTWNLFYGGDSLDTSHGSSDVITWVHSPFGCVANLDQVVATIRMSGADVVGLQEAVGNTRTIAQQLGWYFNERMQVISRYPLIDPPGGNGWGSEGYIFVEPIRGYVAAIANVHLNSTPYGPYLVEDGATLDQVISLEDAIRMPGIQHNLRVLPQLASMGIPVLMTGDFNSPSYLDWTADVAAVRSDVRYPVDWPVSQALADNGFRDSYREIHPDPVLNPGFTWTPFSPEEVKPNKNEVHDRIDWVLSAGPVVATDSQLMGEAGNPDVNIVVDPWPSDHRAVVSAFEMTPGVMPVLVAVEQRSLSAGDTLSVRFHAPGQSREAVAIVPAGGSPSDAVASQSTAGLVDGTLSFATDSLAPRAYEAVLVAKNGNALARITFWLYLLGAPTTVTTSKSEYKVGEPIVVSWTNAPGMRWDWLSIYDPGQGGGNQIVTDANYSNGASGGPNYHYLVYEYTHASIEGMTAFTSLSSIGWSSWPVGPGNYEVRLLLDDGYQSLAFSAMFTVTK